MLGPFREEGKSKEASMAGAQRAGGGLIGDEVRRVIRSQAWCQVSIPGL